MESKTDKKVVLEARLLADALIVIVIIFAIISGILFMSSDFNAKSMEVRGEVFFVLASTAGGLMLLAAALWSAANRRWLAFTVLVGSMLVAGLLFGLMFGLAFANQ